MSMWVYKQYRGIKTVYYYKDFVVLDTETSHIEDKTWINSIQVIFQGEYYHFRKPSELMEFYLKLINKLNINSQHRLVTVIHNASYDLAYLLPFIQKYLPNKEDRSGIYKDVNKITQYRQGGLEFRDSLVLSQEKLASWSKTLNTVHKKQVGIYDYSKIIYQDTELSEDEKLYDKYDVLALYDCYKKQMEIYGDTVATVPNTSTGYVRRDFRKSSQKDKHYRRHLFLPQRLYYNGYNFCLKSYSGGYTHNNRLKKDTVVRGLIGHRDFRSMYPSVMMCYPLPFGGATRIYKYRKGKTKYTVKEILDLYPKYSTISKINLSEVGIKDKNITMPFLQYSKMEIHKTDNIVLDNGRILYFKGHSTIFLDNHTLKIISEQYNLKGRIMEVLAFENMYMPKSLAVTINHYFREKANCKIKLNEAKEKHGKHSEEYIEADMYYTLAKRKLNGIYGMFATNPVHSDIDFENLEYEVTNFTTEDEISIKLDEYYNSANSFLPYQVGVFVTALARYELYEYINTIGYENCLYCDTDSIFYIKNEEIEKRIEKLNNKKHENAVTLNAYITDNNGKDIYYDVFEQEEDLIAFKGLHAKCYGFVTTENKFECTIAGIPSHTLIAKNGDDLVYLYREEELGGITKEMKLKNPKITYDNEIALDNLKNGFKFKTNTGTTCQYKLHEPTVININGHDIETSGGGIISPLEEKEIRDIEMPEYEDYIVDLDVL